MTKLYLGETELSNSSKVSTIGNNVEELTEQSETNASDIIDIQNELDEIKSHLSVQVS